MKTMQLTESKRTPQTAIYDKTIPAGKGWMHDLKKGQWFRIVDLSGNQAADTLLYDTMNPNDHYSAVRTITEQKNLYLTTGSILRAESGKPLVKLIADTVGRHDTFGGACSSQSNTVRYAHDRAAMHNCRDTFMLELAKRGEGYSKRDLAPNVNFFMNVPVTSEGGLSFADGISSPGAYVEMVAETDTTVLISNCPQLNNPCSGFNPTPIRLLIWDK
ncbi:urea amidolyase associated protein UAAP2 [Bacillus sp. JCM 19041]|uniref:urea amidolyase associated protein UAAP2 n=1 Tax=Bacillus sp. JCM 19041 TaxID=1460637 RepID=UPI0006D0E0ED